MNEFWRELFTNSVDHRLSFPMPTYTHIFGNHSSSYSHFNTVTCGVQRIAVKRNRNDSDSDLVSDSGEITTFNLLLRFFDQVT
jgi:hypothetical protein